MTNLAEFIFPALSKGILSLFVNISPYKKPLSYCSITNSCYTVTVSTMSCHTVIVHYNALLQSAHVALIDGLMRGYVSSLHIRKRVVKVAR